MSTQASVQHHPLHPMLIPFPIGLWVFSLVSDIIFRAGWGPLVWQDVAYYTMAGGIVGALLAAVPGLIDLGSIHEPTTKRIAVWHMSINLLVVTLYAINLWIRSRGAAPGDAPLWLSIAGIVLLCVSGWLGGELVYVRGVAVECGAKENR